MNTLDSKLQEMKNLHFSKKQVRRGYSTICRIQGPIIYWKLFWDLFTTLIVYSPSVNNYLIDIIPSIRQNWEKLSEEEREDIIAALVHLNKKGKIEKALNRCK